MTNGSVPQRTYLSELPTPEKVLVIMAHPDDAEFFAGGTLAKWSSEGAFITLYLITSGDKGSGDLSVAIHRAVAEGRESEARAAAERLGIHEIIFQRHYDGELAPTIELRRDIVRMIRLKRPDTVVSSDPLLRWREHNRLNHPDHWTVAEVVQGAVYPAARDHLNFYELFRDEGLAPHKVRYLYMALSLDPNYRIETTEFLDTKIESLKLHRSQVGEPDEFAERMRTRVAPELSTETQNRYAEYFRVIQLD